jgi:hypothetical protein
MTPAERANLEYVYDRLYGMYESGDIRPGEMQQLQDLDAVLRPLQEAEAAQAVAQEQPMLMSREPTVSESVEDWWADKIRRVSGDTPFPLDARESQRLGKRIAGLLEIVPGPSAMMSGAQARRDLDAGEYGSAAMNTAFGLMDVVPGMAAARGGMGAAAKGLSEGMIDVADQPIAREYFANQLQKARASHGTIGKSVDVYSPDEYEGMRMAMTPAGDAGYVVKPDGEVASVVKAKGAPIKDFAGAVLRRSEPQGGNWLNAFDTALPELYGRGGFRPVSRLPFAEDIARGDWGDEVTDAFMAANARYSGGRPDLVFMARDPATPGPVVQGRGGLLTDDYDVAVQELERELRRLGYR